MWVERIALLCILAGTFFLAFSVRVRVNPQGYVPKEGFHSQTMTDIVAWKFRLGLGLIALGTILQFWMTF